MAAERRTKGPKEFNREDVLASLAEARKSLIEALRAMRPKSGLARSAGAVIDEIDEFAFVLTGDRAHFHANAHGSPAANRRKPD
ncbi:hypothetical protein [uncultured Roseibium sp.]|uniref:hypothetical protein n=1 Tax=uncultured Roseibium sp. TaxID=1936171 RepID=UPI00260387B6|nr:hypothetical protein [uncultured Roseibium sp.]